MKSLARYLILVLLLLCTAIFLRARSEGENLPPRQPLTSFPSQIGDFTATDIPIDPDVTKILGDGDFLLRIYRSSRGPYLDFFIAYFPTQRTGSTIHSPQNCLPGSGWTPMESSGIQIAIPGRAPVTVNRYLIAKGMERQLVLYWYQSNGRVVSSEYWSKIYLVTDSVRRNRSDGALVRIVTPVAGKEELASAERRAVGFAVEVLPLLDGYIPR